MSKQHDGFSAFPLPLGDEQINEHSAGMSLRDYFAAKAMQTVLAADVKSAYSVRGVAAEAYSIADAMLVERTK